jgi:hypothetical protein
MICVCVRVSGLFFKITNTIPFRATLKRNRTLNVKRSEIGPAEAREIWHLLRVTLSTYTTTHLILRVGGLGSAMG